LQLYRDDEGNQRDKKEVQPGLDVLLHRMVQE
jgi:hypothetical protein